MNVICLQLVVSSFLFYFQSESCFINGYCFRRWEKHPTKPCYHCHPDKSQSQFSEGLLVSFILVLRFSPKQKHCVHTFSSLGITYHVYNIIYIYIHVDNTRMTTRLWVSDPKFSKSGLIFRQIFLKHGLV